YPIPECLGPIALSLPVRLRPLRARPFVRQLLPKHGDDGFKGPEKRRGDIWIGVNRREFPGPLCRNIGTHSAMIVLLTAPVVPTGQFDCGLPVDLAGTGQFRVAQPSPALL